MEAAAAAVTQETDEKARRLAIYHTLPLPPPLPLPLPLALPLTR